MGETKRAHRELRQAHQELKRTQQQLLHSEKMAPLGRLVAGKCQRQSKYDPRTAVVDGVI